MLRAGIAEQDGAAFASVDDAHVEKTLTAIARMGKPTTMRSLVNVLLDREDPPTTPTLVNESWLLSSISTFQDFQILVFMEDASEQHRNTAHSYFSRVVPKDDGSFELELGVALPDWFPNFTNEQESVVEVRSDDGKTNRIAISNQMNRVTYTHDTHQYHAVFPRCVTWRVYGEKFESIPQESPEILTRTMASMRFVIRGRNLLDALIQDIETCQDSFVSCLNKIATAILAIKKAAFPTLLSPIYTESTFDAFYMIVRGNDPKTLVNWRVVSSLQQAVRRPPLPIDSPDESRMRRMLNGTAPLDDITRLVHSARCHAEGGLLEFALLQLIIAAEIGTGRFVHSMTPPRKRRAGRAFAEMLNSDVLALCPAALRPDKALIKRIDDARRKRNKLMHEATLNATVEYIRKLHDDLQTYIAFLNTVLVGAGHLPLTA